MNIDAPENYSERIPVVQSSMPLSDAQVSINAAPESSPSKTQTGVGGKGDDDSDDWDSEVRDYFFTSQYVCFFTDTRELQIV